MSLKETPFIESILPGLYTVIKKRLNSTPKRSEYREKSYYNTKDNDIVSHLPSYEFNSDGSLKLTPNEKILAKALYEETGPKATIASLREVFSDLVKKLNDPLNGYKKSMHELINSEYSDLEKPYKGSYDTANNAHRLLVDQLSVYYYRNKDK